MLTLNQSPTYQAPVRWSTLDANGEMQEFVFLATFERFTMAQIREFFEGSQKTFEEVAAQALKGWQHVCDASGKPLEFTPGHVQAVLNMAGMATAVVEGLVKSWRPTEGAKSALAQSALESAAEKN
jgi:hypothetical protein